MSTYHVTLTTQHAARSISVQEDSERDAMIAALDHVVPEDLDPRAFQFTSVTAVEVAEGTPLPAEKKVGKLTGYDFDEDF